MSNLTRRAVLAGAAASASLVTACGNGLSSTGAATIDQRVAATMNFLYSSYPGTQNLRDKSTAQLVMPLMTEAGFGIGAAYGKGSLLVNGLPIDYYSATQASVGLQIGAQQYAHVLFFMTEEALLNFRNSNGWAAGADIEYAWIDQGGTISAETTTSLTPVIATVFGHAGAIAGASLEGIKYNRIIP